MASIADLAHHLLKLDPQSNLARLALYHYLKNCCSLKQTLTSSLVQRFYRRALAHNYWQENREALAQIVLGDLISFASRNNIEFDPENIAHADTLQVVHLDSVDHLMALVCHEMSASKPSGSKLKLVPFQKKSALALMLNQNNELLAQVFDSTVLIRKGQLITLEPHTQVFYSRHMELKSRVIQRVGLSHNRTAYFQTENRACEGFVVASHAFQQGPALNSKLSENQEVFASLKQIEQFFIKASSDPFYQELTEFLQKALSLIEEGRPEAETWAKMALERGQFALQKTFPNDKLLRILITNLTYAVNDLRRRQSSILSPRL